MDAPPIARLVDLVHAFNGAVVEQFKKRVEKLLSDSIFLWRLLNLLLKIIQLRQIVENQCKILQMIFACIGMVRLAVKQNGNFHENCQITVKK